MTGYQALRESAATIDLSERGRIRASGEDRKRLLHAMTTNHVEQLESGKGVYAFFLNAQGRILADAGIFDTGETLLIDVEPEVREKIFQHLDKFIIADDVTPEDVTGSTFEVAIEGPESGERLAALGVPPPTEAMCFTPWGERIVIRWSFTGAEGYRVVGPIDAKDVTLAELGLPVASATEARIVRLEHGVPRYGEDMSDSQIAHETGQMQAISFSKGCYLGQEIVERVRSRGLVNRKLAAFSIDTQQPPAEGTPISAGDKEVGRVTSAAWSPAENATRALGYVRTETLDGKAPFSVAGAPAKLIKHY